MREDMRLEKGDSRTEIGNERFEGVLQNSDDIHAVCERHFKGAITCTSSSEMILSMNSPLSSRPLD